MNKVDNYSENEDDPGIYDSSPDECSKKKEKKMNRRSSQRLSKKPRISLLDGISSSDDEETDRKKRKPKNGLKKQRISNSISPAKTSSDTNNSNLKNDTKCVANKAVLKKSERKTLHSDNFATGSFVISKKDAQVGDPSRHPCIWRIDGKALLQKYEAFDEEGKVLHRNTSVYTGWSPMDKDIYAPVAVDVIAHNNQNFTVELHWDSLKDINMDSD